MQAYPFIVLCADLVWVNGSILRIQGDWLYSASAPVGQIRGDLAYLLESASPPSGRTYPAQFSVDIYAATAPGVLMDTGTVTILSTAIVPSFVANGGAPLSGVAPYYVHFDASGTFAKTLTTRPFSELLYQWNFGDEDGSKWQQGTEAGNESKNVAFGPITGHVFWTTGTRTVTLTVTGRDGLGNLLTATTSKTVTITNADTVFASSTVYAGTTLPVAGSDGVPVGANCAVVNSASSLQTLATTYKRVFLRRGITINLGGTVTLPNAVTNGGIIATYGTGAKPVLVMNTDATGIFLNTVEGWRILDVRFIDNGVYGTTKQPIVATLGGKHLISGVEIGNCRIGVGSEDVTNFCLYECDITGMYDDTGGREPGIGLFPSRSRQFAVLGCNVYDSPITHVARIQGAQSFVISHSRFAKAGSAQRNALSIREWTTTGFDNGGQSTNNGYVSCNIVDNSERGGYALYAGPQSINHIGWVQDTIFERNYCSGKDLYPANFAIASGGVVRFNIFVTRYSYAIGLGLGGNAAGSPVTTSLDIYNNTAYKPDVLLSTHFSFVSFTDAGLASNVRLSNNLIYAPGNTSDGATNGTEATFLTNGGTPGVLNTNYFLANNSNDTQINTVKPWAAAIPVTYAEFAANGYGVNGGVQTAGLIDFFGDAITGTYDIGAISV